MAKEYKVKTLKNGEKRYIFDVNLGYRADGSRIRTTVNAKTVKEGRKKVAELRLGNCNVVKSEGLLFREAYDLYLADCKNKDSPTTHSNKQGAFRKRYAYFEDIKISKIKDSDIALWIELLKKKNYKTITIRTSESGLNAFFNWCVKKKIIDVNPFMYVDRTKVKKSKLNFWTEEQFHTFMDSLTSDYYKLAFTTLFYTGLRKGELFGLKYEDVVDNELHLQRTIKAVDGKVFESDRFKTESSKRIVPIPKWLDFGEGEGFIFNPKDYTHIQRTFKWYVEKTDLPVIRVHDLRHSYVAMLISKGVDIFTIKELVGHAKISMTIDTYGHLYPDKRKEITNLFDK